MRGRRRKEGGGRRGGTRPKGERAISILMRRCRAHVRLYFRSNQEHYQPGLERGERRGSRPPREGRDEAFGPNYSAKVLIDTLRLGPSVGPSQDERDDTRLLFGGSQFTFAPNVPIHEWNRTTRPAGAGGGGGEGPRASLRRPEYTFRKRKSTAIAVDQRSPANRK